MNQIYSAIPLAQTIVESCVVSGIEHVVISPGSRNAPLTIGFSNHPKVKTYSIVDERCAAFFALGIAQQTKKPAAVVCTSGSALLNYYPAVSEAFYSDIPLVVISADRPAYLIDIGDGQTIRQEQALDKHMLYSACLKSDENQPESAIQNYNEIELAKALRISLQQQGPVHINAPFQEPLYNKTNKLSIQLQNSFNIHQTEIKAYEMNNLESDWNAAEKRMIIVGVNYPNSIDQEFIDYFAQDEATLVFTEATSNLHHPSFFSSIDGIIAPIETQINKDDLFKNLQPDILLTFGGMIVSKKIKSFLRNYSPKAHYHIDPKKAYDTFFCLKEHIKAEPNDVFQKLVPQLRSKKSSYLSDWNRFHIKQIEKRQAYIKEIPFSDFWVFNALIEAFPKNEHLQFGNSSTIRYANLFDLHPSNPAFCNRGTSGIDGSTSTAIGASIIHQKPTTFVTGDLSFLYDSNALWNNYVPTNFKIVIINNAGGGIFRILPGEKEKEYYKTYFETTHQLNASHLAKMYNWGYNSANDKKSSLKALQNLFKSSPKKPQIVEIVTPRTLNDKVLLDYFKFIQ